MREEKRKALKFAMVFMLLLSVVFISGCAEQKTTIKSEQQVGEAVTNISQNIEDVSSILTDIDKKLG